jgi:hypothetical protein
VRYHASELSQGVTAAILAWPPPGAAAAFSTRLGQAGTAPGSFRRLSYNRRSASLEAEAGLEWNTDKQQLDTRGARVHAYAVRGLLRPLRWGYASLLVLELCFTVRADW